jgi:hypothetical protein
MVQERTAVGSFLATGSAMNINLGFIPRFVQLYNVTDTKLPKFTWFKGMTAAYVYKEAIGSTYSAPSYATSAGITAYAGTDAAGDTAGFTLGADSDMNGAADVIYYIAIR